VKKKLLVFVVSLGLFAVALTGLFYILTKQFLFQGPDKVGREVIYEVKLGQSFPSIAMDLQKLGVVKSAEAFRLYARFTRQIPKVKVGEYRLTTAMTPPQVMGVITSGFSVTRAVTIPEGYTIFEIADLLESKGFASRAEIMQLAFDKLFVKKVLGADRESLEGYLYPETYDFTKYMGAAQILESMVKTFKEKMAALPKPYPFGWTEYQVITMASIIEKETGAPQERAIISSVFQNRLKKNMRLQTDPTIIYAKALKSGKIVIDIKRADLSWDHPYNTYMRAGLPPGPISNPGFDALKAAVSPAVTDFYYFVSQNDGTHVFSETYEKHEAAVRKFQLNPKAREGKSWRDLKH
jgi:UPF0755 protein